MGANPNYTERNKKRERTLEEATMNFVKYFMSLGDDIDTANAKVAEVSTECAVYLFPFILGNTQPLIDALNASTLPQMDQAAKDAITDYLTNPQ
jgi:hypothetical protein